MPQYVRYFDDPVVFPQDVALHGCISVSFVCISSHLFIYQTPLVPVTVMVAKDSMHVKQLFAVHKFKSHCHVGLWGEIIALNWA